MRGDRLLTILLLLQKNGGRMTTRELAGRLEVSERTVHRDMEALAAAGIPVYAERGSAGGWRLTEGYRTDLTGMTRDEMQALLLLAVSPPAADLGLDGPLRGALLKLAAAVPDRHKNEVEAVRRKLHIDGAPWHPRREEVPLLEIVQEAVWADRQLSVVYRKDGEAANERLISPLGLVVKNGAWYVVAAVEDGYRSFRISRLIRAEMTVDPVIRPEGFELAAYWEQSTAEFKARLPRYEATIRFAGPDLPLTALRLPRHRLLHMGPPDETGAVTAVIRFDTLESACLEALGFGPDAEVLAPGPLRELVRDRVAAMHAMYAPIPAKS